MRYKHLIAIGTSLMIISCAPSGSYTERVDENICDKCKGFIANGKTTKDEVLRKQDFYVLYKTFRSKNATVLIFAMSLWDDNSYKDYDLVLIFDENDILKKHSVVRTR